MYHYHIRDGSYYLLEDENANILAMMDEVAIVFDYEAGVLLKHGRPELCQKWYDAHWAKFSAIEVTIEMIVGKFDLEELNKCLDISDYIKRFVDNHRRLLDNVGDPDESQDQQVSESGYSQPSESGQD